MWVVISYLHVLLVDICLNSHLIPLSYLSIFDSLMNSAPLFSLLLFLILHILYVYVVDIMITEATTSAATTMGVSLASMLVVSMATHQ